MKKLLLILFSILILISCQNDKGSKKKCRIITAYNIVDKFGGDFEQISNELFFNENGLEYMCYFYDADGSLSHSELYKYEDGVRTQEETYEKGILVFRRILDYDTTGRLLAKSKFSDKLDNKEIFTYDEKGFLIMSELYAGDGTRWNRTVNECDSKGKVIKSSMYFEGTKGSYVQEYKYNKDGKKIESKTISVPPGFLGKGSTEKIKYNNQGNIIERHRLNPDASDRKRNVVEEITIIYKYEDFYCDEIENASYKNLVTDNSIESNNQITNSTNSSQSNTSNNINTTRSSSVSSSDQKKKIETKKRNCYKCKGSGKCRGCTKPQKIRTWRNGWRNHTEIRSGRVVCNACNGNGRYNDRVKSGEYDAGDKCHVSDCVSGFCTCKECKYGNPGECWSCKGAGNDD